MRLKWSGFNEKGTVIIELEPGAFCLAKDTIFVHGDSFTPKDELHVTLIGTRLGAIILDEIKQHEAIQKLLKKVFEEIDWSFSQTGPVHILSRRKNKLIQKSIIMLIEMHGVTEFYEQLRAHNLIDSKISVPPAHVTMYTHNCPAGIGVPNTKVLNTLSGKTLSVDVLNEICSKKA